MKLRDLITQPIEEKNDLNSYRKYRNLLTEDDIESIAIDNNLKHEADFYGLLMELRIPTPLFPLHLEINNLSSSSDYDTSITSINIIKTTSRSRILNGI